LSLGVYDGPVLMSATAPQRIARLALILFLAAPWMLVSVPASAQPTVTITLLSQTPVTSPDAALGGPQLRIAVAVANSGTETLDHLSIRLALGSSIGSLVQYESSLTEPPSFLPFETTRRVRTTLTPGNVQTIKVHADLSAVPSVDQLDSKVYPAEVALFSRGRLVASLTTPVIYVVHAPEKPMLFSWWVELAWGPMLGADGRLTDAGAEAALSPGGALRAPVDALRSLSGTGAEVPVDVVVQPMLLDQAARMADGYELSDGTQVAAGTGGAAVAAGFLDDLASLAGQDGVQVVAEPYSGPSLPAMLSSGLELDLAAQTELGGAVVTDRLGATATPQVARPAGGDLDADTVDWLADRGVTTILGDADEVERPPQTGGFSPPATATLSASSGRMVSVVLPDPSAESLLGRPDLLEDHVRGAQAALGELAMIWKEEPVPEDPRVRGLAVALPSSLPPGVWGPLVERLADAPFLSPSHAQDLVSGVNPAGASATLRAPSTSSFDLAYAGNVQNLGGDVGAYASMLAEDNDAPDRLRRDLFTAEWNGYVGPDWVAGQQWLDAVAATTSAAFAGAQPQVNQVFTLTSREGTIPLRMGDPGGIPLQVDVQLKSSFFEFPNGDRQRVVLERPNQIVTFRIEAKASGQNAIEVLVQAPSGRVISDQRLAVRTTALNGIALRVTLTAAVLLVLLYVRRWFRRRRMST
jgi:hypothetical protein